jgi:hydrogenase maturation protease
MNILPAPDGPNTLVIGIGNLYRGDDAVGLVVARRLKARNLTGVTVIEESGEGAALLDAWIDAPTVIVLDAAHSGSTPGTIHRFDARAERLPSRLFHYSTHAFSLAEAIELARALNQLPWRLIVYGIEGKIFTAGKELSAEVERAATQVVERVIEEVRANTKACLGVCSLGRESR